MIVELVEWSDVSDDKSYLQINIDVTDINDNIPMFTVNSYSTGQYDFTQTLAFIYGGRKMCLWIFLRGSIIKIIPVFTDAYMKGRRCILFVC